MIRYFSTCSGIEAATVAWEPLGWQAVGLAEIDPFASRVLHHHYSSGRPRHMPDPAQPGLSDKDRRARRAALKAVSRLPERANGIPNHGDFTAIDLADVPPLDLLVGGTPCQAFSVAGKRLSLGDARGNLSLAFTVLAHELAGSHGLRWAIWENVPGVLSTDDNAFGCFLGALVGADDPIVLPRGAERWPDAGLVAGPRARAAWRILDAQYFRLAQRRRRVFVVAGLGGGADPAAVLFEPLGLRRHPPAREQAREGVARPLAAGSQRGSGYRNDADTAENLIASDIADALSASANQTTGFVGDVVAACLNGHSQYGTDVPTLRAKGGDAGGGSEALLAFGGNNTSGPIDVATAVNAHGGPNGRQDFESETFVTHALRGDGFDASEDGTGRGTPLVPICFNSREDLVSTGDVTGALGCSSPQAQAIAFDTTQLTHPDNRSNPQPGDPCHPLSAEGHAPAVAFGISCDAFDRSGEGALGNAAKRSGLGISEELSPTLKASRPNGVAQGWAVRRLMPIETERLQGFPDHHTLIPGAADGPRYKTHGNSMAVNVMRWIGERIDAAERRARAA